VIAIMQKQLIFALIIFLVGVICLASAIAIFGDLFSPIPSYEPPIILKPSVKKDIPLEYPEQVTVKGVIYKKEGICMPDEDDCVYQELSKVENGLIVFLCGSEEFVRVGSDSESNCFYYKK